MITIDCKIAPDIGGRFDSEAKILEAYAPYEDLPLVIAHEIAHSILHDPLVDGYNYNLDIRMKIEIEASYLAMIWMRWDAHSLEVARLHLHKHATFMPNTTLTESRQWWHNKVDAIFKD